MKLKYEKVIQDFSNLQRNNGTYSKSNLLQMLSIICLIKSLDYTSFLDNQKKSETPKDYRIQQAKN